MSTSEHAIAPAKQGARQLLLGLLLVGLPGCAASEAPVPIPVEGTVTFSRHVARLLQRHCQECHRPGEAAPFALTAYEDAYQRRNKILAMVQKGKMPPWKAGPEHDDFVDARRLSHGEIELVSRWVAAGAPEGDPRDLPPPKKFPTGWALGKPGAVFTMKEPFTVPAGSRDIYRCFTVPIRLGSQGWQFIRAAEVLPGNRKIVHHVLTYLDPTGASVARDAADPGPGYTCFGGPLVESVGGLGGWVPGARPLEIPPGVAWGIQPGAHLIIQVHYHNPGPTDETDSTSVGVHFASGPFDRALSRVWPRAWGFRIPAGESSHTITAEATVARSDFEALSVYGHMHLIGRELRVTAHLPDGTKRRLLYIDDWDFDWQLRYTFKRPVFLPAGTRIEVQCTYDNSAANGRNPNSPPRDVRSGFETTDEMCNASVLGTVGLLRRGAASGAHPDT